MGSRGLPTIGVTRNSSTTCCCLHLRFLLTVPGTLKLAQLMIGSLCETLLITYGLSSSSVIGPAYITFLNTVSGCLWTTSLLMACYVLSFNSYGLIRSSLLELIFSVIAALSLLSSSTYMCYFVKFYVYPWSLITIGSSAYPAMMVSYMLGFVLTVLYGLDAYHAYRHFRGHQ